MFDRFKALALLSLLGACVSEQASTPSWQQTDVKSEIEIAFRELVGAAQSNDSERYFSFFEPNAFTAMSSDGSILPTFEAFRLIYEPQLAAVQKYISLDFEAVEIRLIDKQTAILLNEYNAELILVSGERVSASGAGVQVWVKRSDQWKLAHVSDMAK